MSEPQRTAQSRVAYCRSGKVICVPHSNSVQQLDSFIDQFTLDEQIDLFCVSEALRYRFEKQDFIRDPAPSVLQIHKRFYALKDLEPWARALIELKLFGSSQYKSFGEKLLIGAPR